MTSDNDDETEYESPGAYGDNVSMWGEPYFPEIKKVIKNSMGFYRHYKGGLYFKLGVGKHTETEEQMVLYYSLHYRTFLVRPASMWNDSISMTVTTGRFVSRFQKVSFWHVLRNIWTKPGKQQKSGK